MGQKGKSKKESQHKKRLYLAKIPKKNESKSHWNKTNNNNNNHKTKRSPIRSVQNQRPVYNIYAITIDLYINILKQLYTTYRHTNKTRQKNRNAAACLVNPKLKKPLTNTQFMRNCTRFSRNLFSQTNGLLFAFVFLFCFY